MKIIGSRSLCAAALAFSMAATALAVIDRNSDGVNDVWAVLHGGNLQPETDSDGDGDDNLRESIAGTDPLDSDSRFTLRSFDFISPEELRLSWPSVLGKHYRLEGSTDLSNWFDLDISLAGTGSDLEVTLPLTESINEGHHRFFTRVRVEDRDQDGDGISDYDEFIFGTDPLNASSVPTAAQIDAFLEGGSGGSGGGGSGGSGSGSSGVILGEYVVEDKIGVAHPDQIVELDLRGPRQEGVDYSVTDESGNPVPHQWLNNGRLAVRVTGGLPAHGSRRFTVAVTNDPVPNPGGGLIQVIESGDFVEITNDLVGVRLPRLQSLPAQPLAAVQGVRLRNGTWTATGPNVIVSKESGVPLPVHQARLEWIEKGPLKVVARVWYQTDRWGISDGDTVLVEGGLGEISTTITLKAGQPSILIEEDSDVDASYILNLSAGLSPDEARYQGHGATSVEHGRRPDGTRYPWSHDRGNEDAIVTLPLQHSPANPFGRYLPRWDPWVDDNGWYWQFYQSGGSAGSNLLGLFAGPASRVIGAQYSGAQIIADQPQSLIVRVDLERGRPPAQVWVRNRFSWGLFAGTKADLRPTDQPQPIAQQMNLHGGFNLNKLHRYVLDVPGFGSTPSGLYLDGQILRDMIARLRTEGRDGPYFTKLMADDPALKELWEAWADPTGTEAGALSNELIATALGMVNAFVNGHGIYDLEHHYWHGGLIMSRDAVMINGLLVLADAHPGILASEARQMLGKIAALYGYFLWDDDFVPLQGGHGLNLGTANMPVMQASYRQTYALWLAQHPAFQNRATQVRSQVSGLLASAVNEHGAAIGSSGYILASLAPILNTMQQLKVGSAQDPFQAEPRIAAFGEYYLNLLTPPEARFGGRRKVVSFGDGNTLTTELWGQVGTGLRGVDNVLSERLMEGWRQAGAAHSFFYGSSVLKIDESLPGRDPALTDADFPGALTVLRHGWSTPDETAVWLLNGTWYRDHAHNDLGSVMIYALGAPISLHFGSGYSPRMPGAWMQNVAVSESALDAPWTSPDVSTYEPFGNRIGQVVQDRGLVTGTHWAQAHATINGDGQTWQRRVTSDRTQPTAPVLRIRDDFTGGGTQIVSLALMATGAVDAPGGPITPVRGEYENPSVGTPQPLATGVNRFGFAGQWGVDFDLFVVAANDDVQFYIGEWGHADSPNREANEFLAANQRPFEERQYILRVRSSGPVDMVLVPYRAGQRPADLNVSLQNGRIVVTQMGQSHELPE